MSIFLRTPKMLKDIGKITVKNQYAANYLCRNLLVMKELLLTQNFYPEISGLITWIEQVYYNWPVEVEGFVHAYEGFPENGEQYGPLSIERKDILMNNWGLNSISNLIKYMRMLHWANHKANAEGGARIYCSRIIPEAFSVYLLKKMRKDSSEIIAYASGEELQIYESSTQLSFFARKVLKQVDLVIANSETTCKQIQNLYANTRVAVINPGVHVKQYKDAKEKGQQWRAKKGVPSSAFLVLTLGKICKRKNHKAMLHAIAQMPETEKSKIFYAIAGPGDTVELQLLAKELGIYKRVFFLGEIKEENKPDLLGAADVIAMPSIAFEDGQIGLEIVLLEAAASAVPSIAGSGSQFVRDGETGLIVNANKDQDIYKALLMLYRNPHKTIEMGHCAKEWVKRRDWARVLQEIFYAIRDIPRPEKTR